MQGRLPAGRAGAGSHGAGLVRTTCSSGGGPGAGAGPPGARPSEGSLDPLYPRTYGALLKVAQMVTLLIAFICVQSSAWNRYSAYTYFEVVTICNLIMILVFYLVHLFRLYRVLTCISWPLSMPLCEDTLRPARGAEMEHRAAPGRPSDPLLCARAPPPLPGTRGTLAASKPLPASLPRLPWSSPPGNEEPPPGQPGLSLLLLEPVASGTDDPTYLPQGRAF
ncbi:CKLF-like MARVEL transmembrane domain-containing protein 7 isoform X1 [Hyaena hyaena]|uniref:CKLF-like MARVEL transmembrane domain-containing protein 7 isoform X1 n=1 Tax=Hyaena hyaena TaxID=95912 RepID=UPI0019231870|nr:CKLF-like MARVEL transmembrane domain-containing protein 7 isoform X1 [Hyaena hyaena]